MWFRPENGRIRHLFSEESGDATGRLTHRDGGRAPAGDEILLSWVSVAPNEKFDLQYFPLVNATALTWSWSSEAL